MNEAAARRVLLVRAVEATDAAGTTLTQEDRGYAGRAAAELVRWHASDKGNHATAEAFVAKRGELLAAKLAERFPKACHLAESIAWRPWIGIALPLMAFVIGAAAEHIADPGHVNILAFPLLGLIVWNLVVYVGLLVNGAIALVARSRRKPGWTHRIVAGAGRDLASHASGPLAAPIAAFALDWGQRSAPLVAARTARVLHLSAALLALGAVTGLYVRGLAFEYRAGWESTFLDASTVHRILELFLQPAAQLIAQPFPALEEIAALRWSGGSGGENAARWIYLYTTTVMLAVVVPRLLLAAVAGLRERHFAKRFPLSLDEPYFRRVLSSWRESPAQVRVVAYSYTPAEGSSNGLQRLATQLFGDDTRLSSSRPVAFGEEDGFALGPDPGAQAPDLVIGLFNLGSTPETENHGAFLDQLASQSRGKAVVIVDEAPYRQRLGAQAGADLRLAERRQAWSSLAAAHRMQAVFADLEAADLTAAERALGSQLSGATASS